MTFGQFKLNRKKQISIDGDVRAVITQLDNYVKKLKRPVNLAELSKFTKIKESKLINYLESAKNQGYVSEIKETLYQVTLRGEEIIRPGSVYYYEDDKKARRYTIGYSKKNTLTKIALGTAEPKKK
ncbi:MAG: hypothetical protein ACP5OG_03980 [Candidatus Nanoarchaeia archaeon]